MLKRLKTVARVTICLVLLAPAVVGNYRFARHFLLHLNHPADPFADIPKQMAPVARPLVLLAGGHGRDEAMYGRFARAVGLSDGGRRAIPVTNESLIDISYVTKANPNPQPWDVLLGRDVNYLSYGYVGADDRYHQITYYWGESDSTPSPLVRKVRGSQTGAGKYFVRYMVYLSRDLKDRAAPIEAGGHVLQWQPRYPNIDRIDWSAYEGGGYNGVDELAFSIYATAAEGMTLFMLILWRGRR